MLYPFVLLPALCARYKILNKRVLISLHRHLWQQLLPVNLMLWEALEKTKVSETLLSFSTHTEPTGKAIIQHLLLNRFVINLCQNYSTVKTHLVKRKILMKFHNTLVCIFKTGQMMRPFNKWDHTSILVVISYGECRSVDRSYRISMQCA